MSGQPRALSHASPPAEHLPLLTGRGRFIGDLVLPGMVHVALLRSPHAHARIARLDTRAAARAPGVVAVVTAADLGPANRPLPPRVPHPALTDPRGPRPLAEGVVRHVGEAVAAVVAESAAAAADALERVAVTYEALPAAADVEAALHPDAPRVHADRPDNVAARWTTAAGDVGAILREAPVVVRLRLEIARGHGQPLEPRGVVAVWDETAQVLTLWSSTQAPYAVRDVVAAALGLAPGQVRVRVPDVGGGFGLKGAPYPEEVLVAWLARHLCRPVRWLEGRAESFVASVQDRRQVHEVAVGADREGRVLALDHRFLLDVGAYLPFGIPVGANLQSHVPGPYAIPHLRTELVAVYTHCTPTGPWRGAGRPQANFVVERALDQVARRLGLDPVAVRRRNLIRPAQMPYATGLRLATGTPVVYDSGDYPALLDRVLQLFRYEERRRWQAAARAAGRACGLGVVCGIEASGGGGVEGAAVRVEPDGTVRVAVGSPAQGQAHRTALGRLVAQVLGVRPEAVIVEGGDTALLPKGSGTFGSRTLVVAGTAAAEAARAVRRRALGRAARRLRVGPADLETVDGAIRVRGAPQRTVTWATVAADGEEPLQATHLFTPPGPVWSSGAAACAVELDRETGEVRVEAYVFVHDCGVVLNPDLVEGQVLGAIVNGLGNVLCEHLVYDAQGQLLTATLMDYGLPRAARQPPIRLGHQETPSPANPLGVKGVGESGIITVASALAQAVEDAVDDPALVVTAVPILPWQVLRWLAGRSGPCGPGGERSGPSAPPGPDFVR